jgi:methionyl-tRNA formyltransferase
MKIVFIGCVEFSAKALAHLLTLPDIEIVGVVTRQQSDFNSDFCSLEPLADSAGCPLLFATGSGSQEITDFLKETAPDIVYCFGWSYLLDPGILSIPARGVVGFHPAALPQNRGRHPLIWALALGLSETASTFFIMDEGADSGDILDQTRVPVLLDDEAGSLYARITKTALEQISGFTSRLVQGAPTLQVQDSSRASYWRKRGKADGLIDWRMSADAIHNLVRALTHPYVGAHCLFKGEDVKIWRTVQCPSDAPNIEPGKVLSSTDETVTVKCWGGSILIADHEFRTLPTIGSYL